MRILANASCVAIAGSGLLIEGPPGSGKSSLALALIDRGAALVGDDGLALEVRGQRLWGLPPPNIAGKLEIRGVGIIELSAQAAPLALVLALGRAAERLPDVGEVFMQGQRLPQLAFRADDPQAAVRAEWALRLHGLAPALPTI